jgi:hypothetical protein
VRRSSFNVLHSSDRARGDIDIISLLRGNSKKTGWGKQKIKQWHDTIKTKSEAKSRVFFLLISQTFNKCWKHVIKKFSSTKFLSYQEKRRRLQIFYIIKSSFWCVRQQFLWNGQCCRNFIDTVQDFVHSRQPLRSATSGHTEWLINMANCYNSYVVLETESKDWEQKTAHNKSRKDEQERKHRRQQEHGVFLRVTLLF